MICPHCGTTINAKVVSYDCNYDEYHDLDDAYIGRFYNHDLSYCFCPQCKKLIVMLKSGYARFNRSIKECIMIDDEIDYNGIIYPANATGRTLDSSIPEIYAKDYREAENILKLSPRSTATLCRRLLQAMLHDKDIKARNLANEIEEFAKREDVPPNLIADLNVLRKVGNFAAHPNKLENAGEIIEVECGEADLLLEIIYQLFDFIYVRPQSHKKAIDKIKKRYDIPRDAAT